MFKSGWQFFLLTLVTYEHHFDIFKILTIEERPKPLSSTFSKIPGPFLIYIRHVHVYTLFFTSVHTDGLYSLDCCIIMFHTVNISYLTISLVFGWLVPNFLLQTMLKKNLSSSCLLGCSRFDYNFFKSWFFWYWVVSQCQMNKGGIFQLSG